MSTDEAKVPPDALTETDRLILRYVQCQNRNGRGADEEETCEFVKWCRRVTLEYGLIKLVLDGKLCVTMSEKGPEFWKPESE